MAYNEYISKENVVQELETLESEYHNSNRLSDISVCAGINTCIRVVKKSAALNVKPVVYGHWKDSHEGFYCSICHYIPYSDFNLAEEALLDDGLQYCGHCGASMNNIAEIPNEI